MKYQKDKFSVAVGSKKYRDNWARIFEQDGKEEEVLECVIMINGIPIEKITAVNKGKPDYDGPAIDDKRVYHWVRTERTGEKTMEGEIEHCREDGPWWLVWLIIDEIEAKVLEGGDV